MIIVIAKYEEDVRWAEQLKASHDVVVYDKSDKPIAGSIHLKNIGREADTYIQHIVNNYGQLDGHTVFCQGNPFPHAKNFISDIDNIDKHKHKIDYIEIGRKLACEGNGSPHHRGLKVDAVCRSMLGRTFDRYHFVHGAQFMVSQKRLESKPIDFYQSVLTYIKSDQQSPWILERLWGTIFRMLTIDIPLM